MPTLAASRSCPRGADHLASLRDALAELEADVERLEAWGERLADVLAAGGRLLAVGNGGSAAQAQHLTAELVGRYRTERQPLSAICLHGDTSQPDRDRERLRRGGGVRAAGARATAAPATC